MNETPGPFNREPRCLCCRFLPPPQRQAGPSSGLRGGRGRRGGGSSCPPRACVPLRGGGAGQRRTTKGKKKKREREQKKKQMAAAGLSQRWHGGWHRGFPPGCSNTSPPPHPPPPDPHPERQKPAQLPSWREVSQLPFSLRECTREYRPEQLAERTPAPPTKRTIALFFHFSPFFSSSSKTSPGDGRWPTLSLFKKKEKKRRRQKQKWDKSQIHERGRKTPAGILMVFVLSSMSLTVNLR